MRAVVLKLFAAAAMILASSSAVLADDPPAPLKQAKATGREGVLGDLRLELAPFPARGHRSRPAYDTRGT